MARTLGEIQRELEAAAERRSAVWRELSVTPDPEKSAEIGRLNKRIDELWSEARLARSRLRFGSQQTILARARAEDRLERAYAKVA